MILEKVRFNFLKFGDKDVIFRQGEQCDKLVFLLSGNITSEISAPCGTFTLEEKINQPTVVEIHSLFGMNPTFKATYCAQGEAALLTIDKQYIFRVMDLNMIFRINFFNLLSSKIHKMHEQLWDIAPQGLEGRLTYLIRSLCTTTQGIKTLRIKMEDLANLLDDTRLNISNVLNKWQNQGLIEMRRKEFVFHDLERLSDI